MAEKTVDLFVVGAGVAGLAAATRAAARGLSTVCAEEQMFGGLVLNIAELDPAPPARPAQGADLAAGLMEEAEAAGVAYLADGVLRIDRAGPLLRVETAGEAVMAHAVVVASGARHRTLDVPGAQEFEHRGVAHCADCDASFYAGRDVVVVGGGDSALQEALVLARHCRTVFIVHRDRPLTARARFVEAVTRRSNIRLVPEATVQEIRGTSEVTSVIVCDAAGSATEIPCAGVFPFVGLQPNTSFLPADMRRDEQGFLLTNEHLEASVQGTYAIGAVRSAFGGSLADALADAERVVEVLQLRYRGGNA